MLQEGEDGSEKNHEKGQAGANESERMVVYRERERQWAVKLTLNLPLNFLMNFRVREMNR